MARKRMQSTRTLLSQPMPAESSNHTISIERHLARVLGRSPTTSRPPQSKPHPSISFLLVYGGKTPIRIVQSPALMFLPDGRLGAALKNRVFPIVRTYEYHLVDIKQSDHAPKRLCSSIADRNIPLPTSSRETVSALPLDELSKQLPGESDRGFLRNRAARHSAGVSKQTSNAGRLASTIERLKERSLPQLVGIWKNAIKALSEGGRANFNSQEISAFIEAVETEWSRRTDEDLSTDEYFRWPSTDVGRTENAIGSFEAQGEGMLSYLEYHVGRSHDLAPKVRRAILERIFRGKLPTVFSKGYMDQWGEPQTSRRLQKTAECIAAFARNSKRRDDDRLDQAIREWEADLDWLFDEFYVGHFRFAWPTTRRDSSHCHQFH
ncbi:hypothetical protein CK221_01930 [Mesorhizobium sp. WSM3868]|nr:hypothetical protein CK221_01930 [Mesorhizobium sp. WSM3868]